MNTDLFNDDLLQWFSKHKRDLPWRTDKNPFHIWMSEVMLQQTQVKTVIPYYEKFIDKYPTLDSLANQDETKLLKDWEGLGYYNRIRNFHTAVKEVQENYNSSVPRNPSEFRKLRGVGPYIEGAVMSIAFNEKIAAVDGNVLRVYTRLFMDARNTSKQKTQKDIKHHIESFMSDDAGDFNEAMMELGATICKPRTPHCIECPVKSHCLAYKNGKVHEFPVKDKAPIKNEEYWNVYIIRNTLDEVLLLPQEENLLKGMYEFPKFDVDTNMEKIALELGIDTDSRLEFLGSEKHVFTHKVWYLEVYEIYTTATGENFYSLKKLSSLPMSKGMQKVKSYILV